MFKFLKEKFSKVKNALSKTRAAISGRISALFKGPLDEEAFEKLEQILYEADLGSEVANELVEKTRIFAKKHTSMNEILPFLHDEALTLFEKEPTVSAKKVEGGPEVIIIVGVNGSGKTTSIAKLCKQYQESGKSVLLAAGDTFRAAAIDQLATWAERLDVPIVKSTPGGDPAALAFDAVQAAKSRGIDTIIIDTAGRLQNKTELMRELEKVVRVIQKVIPEAPHQTLLVLDATTGQNAVDQTEVFNSFTPLTGIILSKLDGSAKGGIALSIYKKLGIPIEWVGLGEQMDDLMPFDKKAYVDAIFGK